MDTAVWNGPWVDRELWGGKRWIVDIGPRVPDLIHDHGLVQLDREAITLFVEDLDAAKRFYGEVLDLPVEFQDDDSAAFRFANTLVNLLRVEAVPAGIGRWR